MAIRPIDLDNREKDTEPPATRTDEPAPPPPGWQPAPPVGRGAAAELRAIRERIAAAKKIKPSADRGELHCSDCFRKGRDAALRVIEGDESG